MRVGAAWSTSFARRGIDKFRYRRLRYAYRAPSFFLQGMLGAGCEIAMLDFDEDFQSAGLVGGRVGDLAILYVATHGMQSGGGFELAMHRADWALAGSGFGTGGPVVVVFDACDLVDPGNPNWELDWQQIGLGAELRLVLGFSSQATVGEESSKRGAAFAQELLDGMPLASAWFAAVQHWSHSGNYDRAIAIALGDDWVDADQVLRHASLNYLPPPRVNPAPVVVRLP